LSVFIPPSFPDSGHSTQFQLSHRVIAPHPLLPRDRCVSGGHPETSAVEPSSSFGLDLRGISGDPTPDDTTTSTSAADISSPPRFNRLVEAGFRKSHCHVPARSLAQRSQTAPPPGDSILPTRPFAHLGRGAWTQAVWADSWNQACQRGSCGRLDRSLHLSTQPTLTEPNKRGGEPYQRSTVLDPFEEHIR
jgi:hypothetical protein